MTATNTNTTTTTSRDSLASLMLDDVVFKKTQAQAQAEASRSRTLQDIIREEETNHGAKDRNSWKAFKEKLRLKRALGSAWSSSAANTNNDDDDEDDSNNINGNGNGNGDGNLPAQSEAQNDVVVGVSLMDLLEETTEQEMELCRASDEDEGYVDDDDDDGGGGGDDVEECKYKKGEAEEEGKEGLVEYKCCVCMVRHKGAAFIPCGHTFCRTCSREVWVTRGNCPLCNNLILEILDIF